MRCRSWMWLSNTRPLCGKTAYQRLLLFSWTNPSLFGPSAMEHR